MPELHHNDTGELAKFWNTLNIPLIFITAGHNITVVVLNWCNWSLTNKMRLWYHDQVFRAL